MTTAHWLPISSAAAFQSNAPRIGTCDLSVLHVGGEWQWLVRQAGRDVAEGAACTFDDARREAIAAAVALELD